MVSCVGKTRSKWINLIIIIQVICMRLCVCCVYAIDASMLASLNDVLASKFTVGKLHSDVYVQLELKVPTLERSYFSSVPKTLWYVCV